MSGLGIFQKRNKLILIGTVKEGLFQGPGIHMDLSEYTLYMGGLKDSMKDGAGILMKFKSPVQFQQYTKLFE